MTGHTLFGLLFTSPINALNASYVSNTFANFHNGFRRRRVILAGD